MARANEKPMNPRDRDQSRELDPMDGSRKRGKSAASEQQEPALPEQNRKLGKRHD